MPEIIGIRFKSCGKIYHFEANGLKVQKGDRVIVESEFGLSIGNVVQEPQQVESAQKDLKRVIRLADEDDFRQKEENEKLERQARNFCFERIMARGLPMKLVCTEITLDKKRIIFYFTADGRIDFRELVKDLAAKFKTRIEMRQIGVRDKAKLVGGLGLCGKELCCRLFLTAFEPISIKMAKQQDLTLNTGKLSGICGRLMCCLGYEYNDSRTAAAATVEEKAEAPVEEEAVAPEQTLAAGEFPCCAAEPARAEDPAPQKDQKEEKQPQKQDGFRKRRKRRRYRRKPQKNEE